MDSHHQPPESESGALLFELRGYTKWFRGLESNQLPPAYEADERPVLFPGIEKTILRPALPRHGPHYECGALLTSATEEFEMVLPRGLAPRSSAFAERRASLTLRELKMVRHAGAAPAPAVWKTAVLAVTPMTRMKMVAASGIAPDSPRLQRGADLSQLHSQWSLRAVSRRGLSLIGRGLCF